MALQKEMKANVKAMEEMDREVSKRLDLLDQVCLITALCFISGNLLLVCV